MRDILETVFLIDLFGGDHRAVAVCRQESAHEEFLSGARSRSARCRQWLEEFYPKALKRATESPE